MIDEEGGHGVRPAEIRSARADRWAHRRGEPRVFALGWTIFLFAATIVTFVAAQSAGVGDRSVIRAAARMLLFASAVGITILWPMVRLSQAPDPRPIRGVVRDLLVLLIPVQAMLWPQATWWLARWPVAAVAAADGLLVSWGVVVGGVLAVAQVRRAAAAARGEPQWSGGARAAAWMAAIVVLATAGSLALAGGASPDPLASADVIDTGFRLRWMLSPLTGVFELTRDRTWSGVAAAVTPWHGVVLLATFLFGIPAWVVAWRQGKRLDERAWHRGGGGLH